MSIPRLFCKAPPFASEKDGSIGFGGNKSLTLESLDRLIGGDVRDAEAPSELRNPCFAPRLDQIRDHLHVVLSQLLGMILPSAGGITSDWNPAGIRFLPMTFHRHH
jgi:hypothetical protein